jgi:hypothetical protein
MQKAFRFEDYQSAEDASAALNSAFPPGASSSSLRDALGEARAKCYDIRPGLFTCQYNQKSRSFVQTTWDVAVETDADARIKNVGVRRSLTGP